LNKINKSYAIERLDSLRKQLFRLDHRQDLTKWKRDTEIAIEYIFGKEGRHLTDFTEVFDSETISKNSNNNLSLFLTPYYRRVIQAISILSSFIDEINEYWDEKESGETLVESSAIAQIESIIRKFHSVARKLQSRYAKRSTIEINDEYDVQDLFSALLCLYFEDIRPEEYTPSYAGSASRVDFLLKKEKIVIEIKKTRQNLRDKEIGEQLIIDAQKYRSHQDCERLICFVYDPEGKVANPRGIENDLTREFDGLPVSVFITPH
jgi:hypothetical protein